jgi:hypothetical protein
MEPGGSAVQGVHALRDFLNTIKTKQTGLRAPLKGFKGENLPMFIASSQFMHGWHFY